ncbi:MAG: amidohydrolase [Theionarchaea archaeon]|nr:amidohydrolase [Theionarchaea archaeon]
MGPSIRSSPISTPFARIGGILTIYDSHIHIPGSRGEIFHETGTRIRRMDELVAILDRYGIDKGVIFSTVSTLSKSPEEFIRGNREVKKNLEDYPNRFWGACTVHPNFLEKSLEELEVCRNEFGFPWMGEMCPYLGGYSTTSNEMLEVIGRASDLGYIVHLHCNNDEVECLITEFPDTTFVFAHLQSFADCERRYRLVGSRKDLYVDISGSEIVRHGILELALEIAGPERLLFGSDLIIDNPIPTIARIDDLDIPRSEKERIFWRNMDDLLKKSK